MYCALHVDEAFQAVMSFFFFISILIFDVTRYDGLDRGFVISCLLLSYIMYFVPMSSAHYCL